MYVWMQGRRTPHGARGLKLQVSLVERIRLMSHPAWGAWIETRISATARRDTPSRTPHGARGLKHIHIGEVRTLSVSHPAWGAWIETARDGGIRGRYYVAPRMGRVD